MTFARKVALAGACLVLAGCDGVVDRDLPGCAHLTDFDMGFQRTLPAVDEGRGVISYLSEGAIEGPYRQSLSLFQCSSGLGLQSGATFGSNPETNPALNSDKTSSFEALVVSLRGTGAMWDFRQTATALRGAAFPVTPYRQFGAELHSEGDQSTEFCACQRFYPDVELRWADMQAGFTDAPKTLSQLFRLLDPPQ